MADALTSYTAIRQISQFVGAIVFFHVSEYFLAIFFHGRANVSCSCQIMRHPSYCGFFVWAIGTQFMLCNPISFIGFLLALWRFFSKRIPYPKIL
ncbi:Pentatricopeptide repeat-containing protein [Carex littledalei]|uniref:Protein-S-isoprenylcysteine O-methyltransferase n=1 Tax=Carex littledalei TaxID=544730 RepID=A0A833QVP8_9POAL|nr:Pentatricopeptide repeat-containing protein [Carex littledalei]